jgi:hypothetical protein
VIGCQEGGEGGGGAGLTFLARFQGPVVLCFSMYCVSFCLQPVPDDRQVLSSLKLVVLCGLIPK